MVLRNIEDVLERMVEGVFSRAFKADLQPVEVGRTVIKELDVGKQLDVQGREQAPNVFFVSMSPEDHEHFTKIEASVIKELRASIREYAHQRGYVFAGQVDVQLESDDSVRVGQCKVAVISEENLRPDEDSHCFMEAQGGVYYQLQNKVISVGRLEDCDIMIDDDNISRNHAELRPAGDSFWLIDLDSTNGCRVNGKRRTQFLLSDGDEVQFGPAKLYFRQQ